MAEKNTQQILPSSWRWASLGEICDKITDGTHHSPANGPTGSYKYVTAKNIKPWGLDLEDITYVTEDVHREIYSRCDVRKDDILYVKDGATTGRVAVNPLDEQFSLLSSVGVLRPSSIVLPKYLMYALQNPVVKDSMLANVAGVAITRLTLKKLKASEIPLAPLDQQKRIVAEIEKQFSRLDEAVANLKRVKANLKRYKAAVLKAAVEGRLVETEAELARREGRSYETGEQLLQRILETRRSQWQGKGKYKEPAAPDTTNLPELPEGWVWATMPQLGELGRGKSKHRPRDDAALYGGPYPFIQTGDVRRSEGSISEYTQTYSELGLAQSRLWPVGTLCITIAANIAETGILTFASCFPDSVVGFIAGSEAVTTKYVELFLRTAKSDLERFAPATAQKNINLEVLVAVSIALPPLAEQLRIVAEVDRHLSLLRETEAQVDANLRRAERLRQSTLSRVFSGQHLGVEYGV